MSLGQPFKHSTAMNCKTIYLIWLTADSINWYLSSSGCLPSRTKNFKVMPLFKNSNAHVFTNAWLISKLSQFTKTLEKRAVNALCTLPSSFFSLSLDPVGVRRAYFFVEKLPRTALKHYSSLLIFISSLTTACGYVLFLLWVCNLSSRSLTNRRVFYKAKVIFTPIAWSVPVKYWVTVSAL